MIVKIRMLSLSLVFCGVLVAGNAAPALAAETSTVGGAIVSSGDNDARPPKHLTAKQMSEHPGAKWYAVRSTDGAVFGSEDHHIMPAPTASPSPGDVTPYLIDDPVAWSACFVAHDEDYPLATYTYWDPSSNPVVIKLDCGYHSTANNTGFGWWHISAQHETEWRNRIIQAEGDSTGAGWDDLMSWANDTVIGWPFVDQPRGSNNTRCVSAPVLMYNTKGEWLYTFNPTVVFGTDTKHVVTSFPSTNSTC